MAGAVVHILDEIRDGANLKSSDIANIVSVSKATVTRWDQGKINPHPSKELLIADLRYVILRLNEFYSPDETRIWLRSKHPMLEGQRAIDLIHNGESERVLEVISTIDESTFS